MPLVKCRLTPSLLLMRFEFRCGAQKSLHLATLHSFCKVLLTDSFEILLGLALPPGHDSADAGRTVNLRKACQSILRLSSSDAFLNKAASRRLPDTRHSQCIIQSPQFGRSSLEQRCTVLFFNLSQLEQVA